MKIVIFAPYFYPHKGGLEKFCEEIANRVSPKHSVFVVTSQSELTDPINEEHNNYRILRLTSWNLLGGTYPIPKPFKNGRVWKELAKLDADAVVTNTRFFLLSFLGQRFARKNKIASFHIEHGTCYPQLKNPIAKLCAILYDQTLGRLTFKLTKKTIAISQAAADFSRKLGAKGKIDLVYNSIDTDFFKPEAHAVRKDITFVGRLIEGKGVQDLIEAFKGLEDEDLALNIIGNGNYANALKELGKGNKRIIFHGEKSHEEIRGILEKSLIFVNPSYSEGLPTSVLEAGAMECAVIATDVGGTKEIIENNVNGYLIPIKRPDMIKDRLNDLLGDQSKCNSFGKSARKKIVEKFDWNIAAKKLIDIIEHEAKHKD